MKKRILIPFLFSILFSISIPLQAGSIPQSKEEFCSRFGTSSAERETIQDLSTEAANLMSFKNDGGLFNGGVCWWHSRFQRNILYLSIFRPDLPKPTTTLEIKKIIHQVRLGTSIVTVAGYANLAEFSAQNQKLIQSELNDWQLYDGVVLGSWIDGLKGDTKVSAATLQAMMNEVYNYVAVEKKIAYEKLQIKGITSHAWLIVGMKQMPSGIELGYIDSNNPRMSEVYSYKLGDQSFNIKGYGDFVPYLEFKREELRISNVGKDFCGVKKLNNSDQLAWEQDYQRDLKEAISPR